MLLGLLVIVLLAYYYIHRYTNTHNTYVYTHTNLDASESLVERGLLVIVPLVYNTYTHTHTHTHTIHMYVHIQPGSVGKPDRAATVRNSSVCPGTQQERTCTQSHLATH